MDKSYKRAIEVLNRSRRHKRPSIELPKDLAGLKWMPGLNGESDMKGIPSIVGMSQWLNHIGHSSADVDNLNVIHIAGTKGKGSTCAFVESFLRAHGKETGFPQRTGLYTSPHLVFSEERIRINFKPLSKDVFAKYFFEVHDALSQQPLRDLDSKPRYLQLMLLVSFHTFIREGVDAAIFETHHGGEYDSTNVIEKPVVTAITPLGLDHIKQLGPSIENIAWHKAGILKSGVPAFSAPQESVATEVLRKRASDKGASLHFVNDDTSIPANKLQLKPEVQRRNCSLALAVVRSFLDQKAPKTRNILSSSIIHQGIDQFCWPGRFQVVIEEENQWFLDGAHNEMSIAKASEWYIEVAKLQRVAYSVVRILIFSQITDQRDERAVFQTLATSLRDSRVQHVIFTTYRRDQNFEFVTDVQSSITDMPSLHMYSQIWKETHPNTTVYFEPKLQGALDVARRIGKEHGGMQTLITGSLHLIGGALWFLKPHLSNRSDLT